MIIALRFVLAALLCLVWIPICHSQVSSKPVPGASKSQAAPVVRKGTSGPTKFQSQGFEVIIDRPPVWVEATSWQPVRPHGDHGWQYVLSDHQTQVGKSVANYWHIVRRVNTSAGLVDAAQIRVGYEPSYQSLVLHELEIRRGTQVINRLSPGNVSLLRRETRLEAATYDGFVTADLNVGDLRVGDYISYKYTIVGNNPILEGRLSDFGDFQSITYTNHYRWRLQLASGRDLTLHLPAGLARVDKSLPAGGREILLEAFDVHPSLINQRSAPAETVGQFVHATEFSSWADVAAWGIKLFDQPDHTSVADAARQFAGITSRTDQVQAVLSFVQNEIRYLSVSLGASSHLPAPPAKVLQQRYGDCKDKVVLMRAILRELGVESYPILVSAYLREEVMRFPATHIAFDHVILGLEVDGRKYWLDPTRVEQSGALEQRQAWTFGHGLPLKAGATTLEQAPPRPEGQYDAITVDTFEVANISKGARLESRVIYHGDWANGIEALFRSPQSTELKRSFFDFFQRAYPDLSVESPIQGEGNSAQASYLVRGVWNVPEVFDLIEGRGLVATAVPWTITQALVEFRNQQSKGAIHLGPILRNRHTVIYRFNEDVFQDTREIASRVDGKHFLMSLKMRTTAREAVLEYEFRTLVNTVPAAEVKEFLEKVQEVFTRVLGSISIGTIAASQFAKVEQSLKDVESKLRRGEIKAATDVQRRAHIDLVVHNAVLDGGRVSDRMRAELLRRRAISLDHIDQPGKALVDLDEAAALDKTNARIWRTRSVVDAGQGRFKEALESLKESVRLAQGEASGTRYDEGRLHFYLGDYGAAAKAFEAAVVEEAGQAKAFSWLWLNLAKNRGAPIATERLAELHRQLNIDKWPLPIVRFMRGEIDDAQLLKLARDARDSVQRSQLCEANFYIGQRLLSIGDTRGAIKAFERVIDTEVAEYIEFKSAKIELARLKEKASAK